MEPPKQSSTMEELLAQREALDKAIQLAEEKKRLAEQAAAQDKAQILAKASPVKKKPRKYKDFRNDGER